MANKTIQINLIDPKPATFFLPVFLFSPAEHMHIALESTTDFILYALYQYIMIQEQILVLILFI
jgi:hypothetical protein